MAFEFNLQQHFWIVPSRTLRQDQWYKRTYQSWKKNNNDREPIVFTPKTSREDWMPELQSSAVALALALRQKSEEQYRDLAKGGLSTKHSIFPDTVFHKPLDILGPDYVKESPLEPTMQRRSYWTDPCDRNHTKKQTHRRAIKALLVCEQVEGLCYLARYPGTHIKSAAHMQGTASPGSSRCVEMGWCGIIDELLENIMALVILRSYSETLSLETAYETWVPLIFPYYQVDHGTSMTREKLEAILSRTQDRENTDQNIQKAIDRCFTALVASSTLLLACDVPPRDLEQRVINAYLYFVGYECWNRGREGQSYLACDLNVRKDGAWLKKLTGRNAEAVRDEAAFDANRTKPKDPLHLREAMREDVPEMTEEQMKLHDQLADLEAQEVAYGKKRSTKYTKRFY